MYRIVVIFLVFLAVSGCFAPGVFACEHGLPGCPTPLLDNSEFGLLKRTSRDGLQLQKVSAMDSLLQCTLPGTWSAARGTATITINSDLTGLWEYTSVYVYCSLKLAVTPTGVNEFFVVMTPYQGDCVPATQILSFTSSCDQGSAVFYNQDGSSGNDIWNVIMRADEEILRLEIDVASSNLWPNMTGGTSGTAVVAKVFQGVNAIAGKTVRFAVNAKEFSGGHDHGGQRPIGTLNISSCITDASGACMVFYNSPEVSGVETLSATVDGNSSAQSSKDIFINVPGLTLVPSSNSYRLTGQTASHSQNHYLASEGMKIIGLAARFYKDFSATLGLNDMSLINGGLFDIDANWGKPHASHRVGRSVDIDRCAKSIMPGNSNDQGGCPNEWIRVPRMEISKQCERSGGLLLMENTYHCEF